MIQQAFGYQSISRTRVFEWYARFKSRRRSIDDDERLGILSIYTNSENIAKIQ